MTLPQQTGRPVIPDYGIPETEEGLLPWNHVTERMTAAVNYWIGSVDPHGRPHATPVWGVWLDGTFFFDGSPLTRRGRNMEANPNVVVHLESGSDVVILQGQVRQLRGSSLDLREKLAAAYSAKYQIMGYSPEPDTWKEGGLYHLVPRQAFAWTHFPEDTTRWKF